MQCWYDGHTVWCARSYRMMDLIGIDWCESVGGLICPCIVLCCRFELVCTGAINRTLTNTLLSLLYSFISPLEKTKKSGKFQIKNS